MTDAVVAALALVATLMQTYDSLRTAAATDTAADTYDTIDGLKKEVPRWRIRAHRAHHKQLKALRRESPQEWADYRRIWRLLWSWSFLTLAAGTALAKSLIGL